MGVRVRVGPAVKHAGPLTVRFFRDGHCLATQVVGRWTASALFGVSEPGEYTVVWQVPGGVEVSNKVTVRRLHDVTLGSPPPPERP